MLAALVLTGSLYAGGSGSKRVIYAAGSGCLGCCQVYQGSFFNDVKICALFSKNASFNY